MDRTSLMAPLAAALTLSLATVAQAQTPASTAPTASAPAAATPASTAALTPDALVKTVASDVLATIQADPALRSGDVAKISALVDSSVMPYVNFPRMTSAAVGPKWREATPEQRQRLQAEFKALLIRSYAGALAQVTPDQRIEIKPLRASADERDVLVRTQVVGGKGEPLAIEFRLERKDPTQPWKIYNLNVLGLWLVENYRTQFAAEINTGGIDGLIAALQKLGHDKK